MSIANVLIEDGWTQFSLENEKGNVCLIGAANKAHHGGSYYFYTDDKTALNEHIKALFKALGVGSTLEIASWNNDSERTFDEVLRVAKEADELIDGGLL